MFVYFNSIDFTHIMEMFNITMDKGTALGIYTGAPAAGAAIGAYVARFFIAKYSRR